MAFDSATLQKDLAELQRYLGPMPTAVDQGDVLAQLQELARQIRAVQVYLAEMAGERQPSPQGAALLALGKASQSERVTVLRKAFLGARGGQTVTYNKHLAARLLAKGIISQPQHKIWKRTNLLPDHIDLRQGRAEPLPMARPA